MFVKSSLKEVFTPKASGQIRTSYIYIWYLYVKQVEFRGGGGGSGARHPPPTTTSNFDKKNFWVQKVKKFAMSKKSSWEFRGGGGGVWCQTPPTTTTSNFDKKIV